MLAIDIETSGLILKRDRIISVAVCSDKFGSEWISCEDLSRLQNLIDAERECVFHNAPFDVSFLEEVGISFSKVKIHDTLIMSHVLNENEPAKDLKSLSAKYLHSTLPAYNNLEAWFKMNKIKKDDRDYSKVPLEILEPYNIEDAENTLKLCYLMKKTVEDKLNKIYNLELDLVRPIVNMKRRGLLVDLSYSKEMSLELFFKVQTIEKELYNILGEKKIPYNDKTLTSPQQLSQIVFGKDGYGLKATNLTKTGQASTDSESLMFFNDNPFVAKLLELRVYNKIDSSFFQPILNLSSKIELPSLPETKLGLLSPGLNQTGAVTGRFSCSNPNLQTLPREGKSIRKSVLAANMSEEDVASVKKAFICRPGYLMGFFDYKQIEIVALAYYSQQPELLEAIRNKNDIHEYSAKLLGIRRWDAKHVNFAIIYGMGILALAVMLEYYLPDGTPDMLRAKEVLDSYKKLFYKIPELQSKLKKQLYDYGYIETFCSRKLRIDYEQNYVALNYLCQGTAADIMKLAMIAINNLFTTKYPDCYLLMTVHDEMIVEIPSKNLAYAQTVLEAVQNTIYESNPLKNEILFAVDAKISMTNWSDAKEIK